MSKASTIWYPHAVKANFVGGSRSGSVWLGRDADHAIERALSGDRPLTRDVHSIYSIEAEYEMPATRVERVMGEVTA